MQYILYVRRKKDRSLSHRLWNKLKELMTTPQQEHKGHVVIDRKHHDLSRKKVSPNALKVLYRLHHAGYDAFLVGGSVRDILLNKPTKDFDVVTNALPEEIKALFSNSRLIGRRFRLVHVYFQNEIIECSTFRANSSNEGEAEFDPAALPLQSDNIYGTIEEDAWRRDFSVNSLYYNIKDFSIIDYTGGLTDLKNKTLRILGDPCQRFHEDPVRLLRAVRIASKLDLTLESATEAAVYSSKNLLSHVPSARLFHEFLKLFFSGHAMKTYDALQYYGYFEQLFPGVVEALKLRSQHSDIKLFRLALKATDTRFKQGKTLNPGFLMSIFLWPIFQLTCSEMMKEGQPVYVVFADAVAQVLNKQNEHLKIPNRMAEMIRSVWHMQYNLEHRQAKRVYRLSMHRYFRAAFDFLDLRAQVGEVSTAEVKWWAKYQKVPTSQKKRMVKKISAQRKKK